MALSAGQGIRSSGKEGVARTDVQHAFQHVMLDQFFVRD
jgi:hypothetical protein